MTDKERIAEITLYELLTEDFVEPVANFYVTDKDRESFYALWRQFKKTLAGYTRPAEPPFDKIETFKTINDFLSWAWQQGHGFDEKNHASQYEIEKVAEMSNELIKKLIELGYTRQPEELDPQAERYDWLIEHGWTPPEEARNYVRTGEPTQDKVEAAAMREDIEKILWRSFRKYVHYWSMDDGSFSRNVEDTACEILKLTDKGE